MASLAEVQAKLREQAARKAELSNGGGERPRRTSQGDNASFPFWNTPVGQTSVLRFIPDGDENNILPWVARETIKLTFNGVVGGDYPTERLVEITVPSVDMFRLAYPETFDLACPITAHCRPWWKEPKGTEKRELAAKYWKKKSWLMQGFVVDAAFEEAEVPENPIRRFTLGKKLFDKVHDGINGTEFESMPTDFLDGCDFRVTKSMLGDQNNYDNSNWARKARSLTEEELAAIEKYGPFDLKQFLGKVPDKDGVDMIYAMFLDSLAGKAFDYASYGENYRPYGGGNRDQNGGGASRAAAESHSNEDAGEPDASSDDGAPARSKATEDLIARIKNRNL